MWPDPSPSPPLQAAACPTTVTSRGGQGEGVGRGFGMACLSPAYGFNLRTHTALLTGHDTTDEEQAQAASTSS